MVGVDPRERPEAAQAQTTSEPTPTSRVLAVVGVVAVGAGVVITVVRGAVIDVAVVVAAIVAAVKPTVVVLVGI